MAPGKKSKKHRAEHVDALTAALSRVVLPVQVVTCDGVVFENPTCVIKRSLALTADVKALGKGKNRRIAVNHTIDSKAFGKVLEWCEHHIDTEFPERNREPGSMKDDQSRIPKEKTTPITDYDNNFCKDLWTNGITEVIMAAYSLKVEAMVDMFCQYIANSIKGKTSDEMREILGVKNTMALAHQARLRDDSEIYGGWADMVSRND